MIIYFTQIDPPDQTVVQHLAEKGWTSRHLPMRRVIFEVTEPLDMTGYDAVLMSSKQAAKWYLTQNPVSNLSLAVVGQTTAAMLKGHRLLFQENPPANASALAQRLAEHYPESARFLFLKGRKTLPTLSKALARFHLVEKVVYRTEKRKSFPTLAPDSMVYFQAPSSVTDFRKIYGSRPPFVGAIGPTTAETLAHFGWAVDFQPSRPENVILMKEIPLPRKINRT